MIALFLFRLAYIHTLVKAREAFYDLGTREKGDAFGIAVHNVFGEVRAIIFAKTEFVQSSLLSGNRILFVKHRVEEYNIPFE